MCPPNWLESLVLKEYYHHIPVPRLDSSQTRQLHLRNLAQTTSLTPRPLLAPVPNSIAKYIRKTKISTLNSQVKGE